jgi:hypothetical protein
VHLSHGSDFLRADEACCLVRAVDVGNEGSTFRDCHELVDHATKLLSEEGLTARLGDAAARRARREHTYDLCVVEILDKFS